MKIVLPVHHFPPRYAHGAELYTFRLARWLKSQGHQVDVVAWEVIDHGSVDHLAVAQDVYQDIPVWRLSMDIFHSPNRRLWTFDNPHLGKWFAEFLRERQPDLVNFQAGYLIGVAPIFAAHEAGVPSIITLHDFWFLCPRHTLYHADGSLCHVVPNDPAECAWCYMYMWEGKHQKLERATRGAYGRVMRSIMPDSQVDIISHRRERLYEALKLPQLFLSPSHFLSSKFADVVPSNKLQVFQLGVDTTRFQKIENRQKTKTLQIGYIGQIVPIKGVHILVEAVKNLRQQGFDIELRVFGTMPNNEYGSKLRSIAADDPKIRFEGRVEVSRVSEVLSEMDALAVPSIWFENSPITILEAHAVGVPVIAAAHGGMIEMILHETDGLHFQPASVEDLMRQLRRLIDEPNLLNRIRDGARNKYVPSVDESMQQISEIYKCVCAQSAENPHAILAS
jgi:glycosyltransferase involved in cell wall biosynthesis